MSLKGLNYPPFVAALGVSTLVAMPKLEKLVASGELTYATLKTLNVFAYSINVFATSRPGRLDSENAVDVTTGSKESSSSTGMKDFTPESGKTLLAPSGWAFAIWGPIFIGELGFVAAQFFIPESSLTESIIKKVSIPFSVAQLFQSLWAASFRPKYQGRLLFISSGMLGSLAYSLSKAHYAYAVEGPREAYSFQQYCLCFLPMTLHFGWTTAATLVNLNNAHAIQESISARTIALLGHASALAATAAGVMLTISRSAPVYGCTISWALFAVADGMEKKLAIAKKKKNDEEKGDGPGFYGAHRQKYICTFGAWACLCASAYSVYSASR